MKKGGASGVIQQNSRSFSVIYEAFKTISPQSSD